MQGAESPGLGTWGRGLETGTQDQGLGVWGSGARTGDWRLGPRTRGRDQGPGTGGGIWSWRLEAGARDGRGWWGLRAGGWGPGIAG